MAKTQILRDLIYGTIPSLSIAHKKPINMDIKTNANWNVLKGTLKEKYSQLTDDDLMYVEGKEDQLIGKLQKILGKSKDEIIHILKKMSEKVEIK
jgi:uncharacterized protein YjbJ (UPF0337 family)